jgi:hypothetical protein
MRKHRRKLVVALVAVILGLTAFAGWSAFPAVPHRINRASYERIHRGMTRAEVETLLSGPAGDYTTTPRRWAASLERQTFFAANWKRCPNQEWIADAVRITLYFDTDETVAAKRLWDTAANPDAWAVRARRWLSW